MGILIIDGNSVYEVDEECLKTHKMPKDCMLPREVWDYQSEKDGSIRIDLVKRKLDS